MKDSLGMLLEPNGGKLNMLEYRLKANLEKNGKPLFFANPTPGRIRKCKEKAGNEFNVVFYRTEGRMETYSIPFGALEHALTDETLSKTTNPRWLTMIVDGTLTISFDGKKVSIDVSMYLQYELTTEVRQGDCSELMKEIPDESVACIITSPPYKEEDGYTPELMKAWLTEAYRILKPDSCMFVNFGHLAGKKERGFKVALAGVEVGFEWNDTIIWVKNHYTPLQSIYRVNNLTEYIYLLTKGKPVLNRLGIKVPYGMPWTVHPGEPAPPRPELEERYGRNQKCGGNVWYIKYEPISVKNPKRHKDRYPVELPLRALKLADPEGVVVDPFNGSGTTGTACIEFWKEKGDRKINYIGFELNPVHINFARDWWVRMRTEH